MWTVFTPIQTLDSYPKSSDTSLPPSDSPIPNYQIRLYPPQTLLSQIIKYLCTPLRLSSNHQIPLYPLRLCYLKSSNTSLPPSDSPIVCAKDPAGPRKFDQLHNKFQPTTSQLPADAVSPGCSYTPMKLPEVKQVSQRYTLTLSS